MSEPQPEYLWSYPEKRKRGRVWLIVLLALIAVAIAATAFWLFVRPSLVGASPAPTRSASSSPAPTASETPTPTPTPTPTSTTTQEPSAPPVQTAPPAPKDPSIATFRDKVSPVLDSAKEGLQRSASDPQQGAQNVGFLQDDASRLAEVVAPSSIAKRWNSALNDYTSALNTLRTAYEHGGSATQELAAAKKALGALDSVTR